MSCDEAEALLPLVADGTIDQSHDPLLFAHLATCDHCQESLAHHDLVSVALEQRPLTAPASRILRPVWQRWVPAAAAALVAIGMASAVALRTETPAPLIAKVSQPQPPVIRVVDPLPTAAPQIEIEVVAVPGSSPEHPHYLVRKGQQVLLVAPAENTAEQAPADAKPASYQRPRRY